MSNDVHLSVGGMSCAGCVATVEKALQGVTGVEEANVNFADHTATVKTNAANLLDSNNPA